MDIAFVEAFPEFRGDVPVFNPRLVHLNFDSDTTQWQYFVSQSEIEDEDRVSEDGKV